MKTKKNRGVVYLPPEKNQNRNQFVFFSFGVDPLNWQSSIEIGAIACSTTTWCSRRLLNMFRGCYVKHSLKYFVAIYRETNINCWEREIVAWEKEITMRDYRLVFLSRWATASQRSVFLSKWRNNWVQKTLQSLYHFKRRFRLSRRWSL